MRMPNKTHAPADANAIRRFLEQGGEIKTLPDRASNNMSWKDWKRATQGLKVALPSEIEAERERRTLIAIKNRDAQLALDLLRGRYDKEIKFDIENDRLGPNGEIR